MIKANELRIGNKFHGAGMDQTVFEIHDNTDRGRIKQEGYEQLIMCVENKNQYKPVEISPISLNHEWMLKLGFEAIKNESYINGIEYCLKVDKEGDTQFNGIGTHEKNGDLVVNVLCRGNYVCNTLDYVHQIQNLYFTLKREELNINES